MLPFPFSQVICQFIIYIYIYIGLLGLLAQGLQWLSLSLLIPGMGTPFMSHTDFGGVSNSMIPPGMKRILPGLQSDKDSPRMFMNVETLNKSIRSYLYQHTFGAYTSAIFIEVSLCPHFGLVPLGTNHWYWGQFQKTWFQQKFEDLDFLGHFGELLGDGHWVCWWTLLGQLQHDVLFHHWNINVMKSQMQMEHFGVTYEFLGVHGHAGTELGWFLPCRRRNVGSWVLCGYLRCRQGFQMSDDIKPVGGNTHPPNHGSVKKLAMFWPGTVVL